MKHCTGGGSGVRPVHHRKQRYGAGAGVYRQLLPGKRDGSVWSRRTSLQGVSGTSA